MLHSQFVPLIVVTMLQTWLGLAHAAFVQKSWLDCGKSLLHTKLGSHHVFFAAMLHSQFVPLIVVTMLQTWLGLGHAAFVQKSWLDCGKSLLHTKLGSHHVFFAAMLHSQFVPLIVVTLQNWLGLGHAKLGLVSVVNHCCHKTGVSPCVFCGNAALTVCAPHCGHNAPKLARSWPCSLCAEVMVGLW